MYGKYSLDTNGIVYLTLVKADGAVIIGRPWYLKYDIPALLTLQLGVYDAYSDGASFLDNAAIQNSLLLA